MRKHELNVLVLGVGGNVSQGILKALALCSLPCRVVAACVTPEAFGLHTVSRSYVSPPAAAPGFCDWLVSLCRRERIDAVLSGAEPVLEVISARKKELEEQTTAIFIVSLPDCLKIGADKLLTARWLEKQGLNFPRSVDGKSYDEVRQLVSEVGYPLLAKPRHGKGSSGIMKIDNEEELELACRRGNHVIQEYLGDEHDEFTAGCFSDRAGQVRGVMVMKRSLHHGTTARADAGLFPKCREEATKIAAALKPFGPCNVQMRKSRGRPVCFEINVRFSGTTPIRARLGFNDVEAVLRHYVLGEEAMDLPLIEQGVAVRYWNEAYLQPETLAALQSRDGATLTAAQRSQVEDYGMNK